MYEKQCGKRKVGDGGKREREKKQREREREGETERERERERGKGRETERQRERERVNMTCTHSQYEGEWEVVFIGIAPMISLYVNDIKCWCISFYYTLMHSTCTDDVHVHVHVHTYIKLHVYSTLSTLKSVHCCIL